MLPQTTIATLDAANQAPYKTVATDGPSGCRSQCRDSGRECYAWAFDSPFAPGECSLWRFPVGIGYPAFSDEAFSGYCTGDGADDAGTPATVV